MRVATVRFGGRTFAATVDGDRVSTSAYPDVGALLRSSNGINSVSTDSGPVHELSQIETAPVVMRPSKIVCVGLNYRNHLKEMGREFPGHPTLFAKYPEALIGSRDNLELPTESNMADWEAELALVIRQPVRRATRAEAESAIAGFAVMNDVTMRDWQYRTTQWFQGKTFEATTPFGPTLVTPDELRGGVRPRLHISCRVDDEVVQEANTEDLLFDPVDLVRYVSTIFTLSPGDVIATGTPGGVGHARQPARYLHDGQVLTTTIEGIGSLVNTVRVANIK